MPGFFCARDPASRARRAGAAALLLGALLAAPAPAATSYTIGGQDLLTEFDATTGILSFSDTGTGALGMVDDAGGIPGLPVGAEVWFEALLSPKRFNGTADFDAGSTTATGRVTRGNFIKSTGHTLALLDTSGPSPVTLLAFDILVGLDDMDGSGNLPQGGVKVGGASVPVPPNDPDGFLFGGNLDADCGGALCRNEVVLVGGALAGQVGGVGAMAHLHVRMDSLNPSLGSLNGYLGSDFTSGNGALPNPTEWDLTILAVPEPGTARLLGLALVAIAALRQRRR